MEANTQVDPLELGGKSTLTEVWSELWRPPQRLSLSEWAERNFVLSPEYSAVTGPIRLYGWQRDIFDSFTDPAVNKIVLKVSTQVVKTLFIQVALAYAIAEQPGPILFVQPKEDDARTFSKERISPMCRDCSVLNGKLSDAKSRDGENTILYKQFPGGVLTVVGAGAPGNAARRSVQYAFLDEVNKYPPTAEGNFVKLVAKRTSTYGTRRKIIESCSPTTPDAEISQAYEDSDQRQPWVPCYFCGAFQVLQFRDHVKWLKTDVAGRALNATEKALSAYIECQHCGARWNDVQRWNAAEQTEWRSLKPFNGTRGFGFLSHLLSPWHKLSDIVSEFLVAKNNPNDYKVFVNTTLAEDWIERGEAPEWRRLYERSRNEHHPLGIVPEGVLLITAGADVQRDRIEVGVRGWGRNRESWIVDYLVLEGDPSRPDVWLKLTEALGRTYPNIDGVELQIVVMAVDTGYATQDVYNWVRSQAPGRVMAVKGQGPTYSTLVGQPSAQDIDYHGKKVSNGVQVWPVGVSGAKSEFYGWLGLPTPTEEELVSGTGFLPGYCHFSDQLAEEFFEQITAEELISRKVKGYEVNTWVKRRPRNEALDAYGVYARAAAAQAGIDRFQDRHWEHLEGMILTQKTLLEAKLRKEEQQPAVVAQQQRSRVFGKFRV